MKKDEVRCIRLQKDQLLELLWACYRGMGYKDLKLPPVGPPVWDGLHRLGL